MKIIDIYTDGSHLDKLNNGRLGCGGVMVDRTTGKLLDEFGLRAINIVEKALKATQMK